MNTLDEIKRNPNRSIPILLMSSYLYYIELERTPLRDDEYDQLCGFVLENWDLISHRHKSIINPSYLEAGSLYYLKKEDYPLMAQSAAIQWLKSGFKPDCVILLMRISIALEKLIGAKAYAPCDCSDPSTERNCI